MLQCRRRQTSSLRIILDHEECLIDEGFPQLLHTAHSSDHVETFSMLLEHAAPPDPSIKFASKLMLNILADGKSIFAHCCDRLVKEMGNEFVISMAAIGGVAAMSLSNEVITLDLDNP